MGPIGCPEMSIRNYHSMLLNIPDDCRHHLHSSWSQKSHNILLEQKEIKKFEINGILLKVKQNMQYVLKMQKIFLFPKHNQPVSCTFFDTNQHHFELISILGTGKVLLKRDQGCSIAVEARCFDFCEDLHRVSEASSRWRSQVSFYSIYQSHKGVI